jgi:hypothetical protein
MMGYLSWWEIIERLFIFRLMMLDKYQCELRGVAKCVKRRAFIIPVLVETNRLYFLLNF